MQYAIKDDGQNSVATLSGRLTFAENGVFRNMLRELEASRGRSWVIDLAGVDFIDSAGLGLLIIVRDLAEKSRATLKLVRPRQQVQKLFEVAKLARIFTIEA